MKGRERLSRVWPYTRRGASVCGMNGVMNDEGEASQRCQRNSEMPGIVPRVRRVQRQKMRSPPRTQVPSLASAGESVAAAEYPERSYRACVRQYVPVASVCRQCRRYGRTRHV